MKRTNNFSWRGLVAILVLPTLLGGGLLLGGCDNDPVAPHDTAPALSSAEVAGQAAWVAMATGIVTPQTVEFTAKSDKNSYEYEFAGDVAGIVHLDFFTGGAGGTSATPAAADYVDMYTGAGSPVVISVGLGGSTGLILLTFDLAADLDRTADPDEALVSGSGTYFSGPYFSTFTFDGVVAQAGSSYPGTGTMVLVGAGFTMTVTFDGDNTAIMSASTGENYVVNLDDGTLTEVVITK